MGHGPVVGHSGFFSGPRSINQNESNMYNWACHPSCFFRNFYGEAFSGILENTMILGQKQANLKAILSEDLFFFWRTL